MSATPATSMLTYRPRGDKRGGRPHAASRILPCISARRPSNVLYCTPLTHERPRTHSPKDRAGARRSLGFPNIKAATRSRPRNFQSHTMSVSPQEALQTPAPTCDPCFSMLEVSLHAHSMRCRMTPARAWRQVPLPPGCRESQKDATTPTQTPPPEQQPPPLAPTPRASTRAQTRECAHRLALKTTQYCPVPAVAPAHARMHAHTDTCTVHKRAHTHTHAHTRAHAPARAFERANHTRAQTPARAETQAPALTHNTQRAHMVARARASDMLTTASQEPADEQSNTDAKLYKQSGPVSCQTLRHCTVLYVVYK